MPVLPTAIDPDSDTFRENERALREGLDLVRRRAGRGPGRRRRALRRPATASGAS